MLKIRLQRVGRKHDPSFRVVVTDSKNGPKSGKALEIVGNYDPRKNVKEVNAERVKHWIDNGAQVSDTLHNILVDKKVISAKKINVLPKKAPIKKESEVVETAPKVEEVKVEAKVETEAPAPAPEVVEEAVEIVEAPKVEETPEEKSSETNS